MKRSKLFIILMLMCLLSCSTPKYIEVPVPVEKVKTEYVTKTDTTIIKDSIYIKETQRHDTIIISQDKYHYIYKVKSDTIMRCDTIPIIKEVKVDVPYVPDYYKNVNRWFWMLIISALLFLGWKIYKKFHI